MQLDSPRRCSAYSSLQQSFQRKSVLSLSNKEFQGLAESVANTWSCATKNTTTGIYFSGFFSPLEELRPKLPEEFQFMACHQLPLSMDTRVAGGLGEQDRQARSDSLGNRSPSIYIELQLQYFFLLNWWPNAQVSKITSYIGPITPFSSHPWILQPRLRKAGNVLRSTANHPATWQWDAPQVFNRNVKAPPNFG